MTATAAPLWDRFAALAVIPALIPYLVALSGAWWLLRHGDDGRVVVEVGSWPGVLVLSTFLWVALVSAMLTAWQLLARPSVYWYRALPWSQTKYHLLASGLAGIVAFSVVTGLLPLVGFVAGLLLPVACTMAFSSAVSSKGQWAPQPESDAISARARAGLIGFVVLAISTLAALETARAVSDERLTIAAYGALSLLGLPWSAALFPIAFIVALPAHEAGPAVFDVAVVVSVTINCVVAVRLAASARYRLAFFSRFFRLG